MSCPAQNRIRQGSESVDPAFAHHNIEAAERQRTDIAMARFLQGRSMPKRVLLLLSNLAPGRWRLL